jgi:hypothetical protein
MLRNEKPVYPTLDDAGPGYAFIGTDPIGEEELRAKVKARPMLQDDRIFVTL